jgi:hypothetical protein
LTIAVTTASHVSGMTGLVRSSTALTDRSFRDPVVAANPRASELAGSQVSQDGLLVDSKAVGHFLGGK